MANVNKYLADMAPVYHTDHGNVIRQVFSYEAAAVAADDVIFLGKVPGGSLVTSVKLITDDLGTGTTLDVGYQKVDPSDDMTDDTDAFFADQDVATAAVASAPITFAKRIEDDAYIVAIPETAAATGTIEVQVEYLYDNRR